MKNKLLIIGSLFGLLAGCTQLVQSPPTPTPQPENYLSTVVAMTGQAAFATADALTPSATPTKVDLISSTEIPLSLAEIASPTPTFAFGFEQYAQIHFLTPGPGSSLISPINLQVDVVSGESEKIQVDLLGEDGRLLQRDVEKVTRNLKGIFRRFDLKFEIRAVSEAGYIRISSKDDFGRLQALNTMPVLLYSIGEAQINPPGNMVYERIMVEGLKEKANYYSGEVGLQGRIWPYNDQPMVVELILPDGKVISTRLLNFNGTETQSFETTLPYIVTEPTLARLSFRQDNPQLLIEDPELGKAVYVYTMEITLNP